MDKYIDIIGKRKEASVSDKSVPAKKFKKASNRQYDDSYLQFGFTCGVPLSLYLVCGTKLANEAMVPSKLSISSPSTRLLRKKLRRFFTHLLDRHTKQARLMSDYTSMSDKCQEASFVVSQVIAQGKQPHTVAENLVVPCCREIVGIILGENAAKEIQKIPLSNNTVSRRINDMAADILEQLRDKLLESKFFSLRLDESTDIKGKCQLLANVRFIGNDSIQESILFCRELQARSTGAETFDATEKFFEEKMLQWKNCVSVCTDAAMIGKNKGFVSKFKQKNSDVQITHCFLHREALMAKTLPDDLKEVLDTAVKLVNFIKAIPLKTRLFEILCKEMGAEHTGLLLHTEVRWLSRDSVLLRIYELKEQVMLFFADQKANFKHHLGCKQWWSRLEYLTDVFDHLNMLNTKMQGRNESVLTAIDKLGAFQLKLKLWRQKAEKRVLEMFPLTKAAVAETDDLLPVLKKSITNHLHIFQQRLSHYFPDLDISHYDWVRNPFNQCAIKAANIVDLLAQEQLLELSMDRSLQLKHNEMELDTFWISVRHEYPDLFQQAILILLPFVTTYLCESAFSSLISIKNKHRSGLQSVEEELRVCLSDI